MQQKRLISIIAPCYNERDNIKEFITGVFELLKSKDLDGELIIVDDDSPDGTGQIAAGMKKDYTNLKVLIRKERLCLSSAVVRGFQTAEGDIMVVMDADLSHPPDVIPRLIEPIKQGKYEMTVGSRYIKGGRAIHWPFKRRIISRAAILLAGAVSRLKDPTSGFFAFKRSVLEGVKLRPKGQKIGLELIAKGNYKNIAEISYVFRERRYGKSKLTINVVRENIIQTLSLTFARNSVLRKLFSAKS